MGLIGLSAYRKYQGLSVSNKQLESFSKISGKLPDPNPYS